MLSSMDSWLAWRTVLLGISTARPVSVLLWMAPFSLRPSPSRNTRGATAVSLHSQSLLHWQSPGEAEKVFWKTSLAPVMQHFPYSALLQQQLPSHLCNTGSALPCQGEQILRACTPSWPAPTTWSHQSSIEQAQAGNRAAATPGTAEVHSLMPPSPSQILRCCLRLCGTAQRVAGPGGHWVSRGEEKARQHQRARPATGELLGTAKTFPGGTGKAPAVENPGEDYSLWQTPSATAERELSRLWFLLGAVFRGSALWN